MRDWDGKELTILRDHMFNCESVYKAWGRSGELNSTDVLMKVFKGLPHKVKTQLIPLERAGQGTFQKLRKFVDSAARDAESQYGQCLFRAKQDKGDKRAVSNHGTNVCRKKVLVGATTKVAAEGVPHPNNATFEQCGGAHRLWHCANFKKGLKDRRDFVYCKKLCFLFLLPNHLCRSCESNIRCKL